MTQRTLLFNTKQMTTRTPTLTNLQPSIENCDPFLLHSRATPHQFALSERPILYGGGRKWILQCSDTSSLQLLSLNHAEPIEVDVFVMTSGLVLWFVSCSKGVEIPYSCLGANALRHDPLKKRMVLYLQANATGALESDCYSQELEYDSSVEFELQPMYHQDERYYNDAIDRLFTFEYFGINKGDKMVTTTFNAITQCSAMYLSETEEEGYDSSLNGDDLQDEKLWAVSDVVAHYEYGYENGGDADDMDMNSSFEDGAPSAIDVVLYDEYGRRRTRDDMELSPRDVKRVRC